MPERSAMPDELIRPDQPQRGALPASQRFKAGDASLLQRELRLEHEVKFLFEIPLAQRPLDRKALLHLLLVSRVEQHALPATMSFGLVEGKVALFIKLGAGGTHRGEMGKPRRRPDAKLHLIDFVGRSDRLDRRVAQLLHVGTLFRARQNSDELVAAEPPKRTPRVLQSIATLDDRAQEFVARYVAVKVVDVLEPIEIENAHPERLSGGDQMFEMLEYRAPVGNAGQGVGVGQRIRAFTASSSASRRASICSRIALRNSVARPKAAKAVAMPIQML